jgi:hypothetical protein
MTITSAKYPEENCRKMTARRRRFRLLAQEKEGTMSPQHSHKILFCALLALACTACGTSVGAQSLSAQPNFNDPLYVPYGTRAPRPCPNMTHAPSAAEAAVLVQCTMEGGIAADNVELLSAVSVQIKGSRPFRSTVAHDDSALLPMIEAAQYKGDPRDLHIDPKAQVYDIVGSANQFNCVYKNERAPGQNCNQTQLVNSPGACWRMNNGQWRCTLMGVSTGWKINQPPPATF